MSTKLGPPFHAFEDNHSSSKVYVGYFRDFTVRVHEFKKHALMLGQ